MYHNPIINGLDGQFSPPVADGPNGGHGPAGSTFKGVSCEQTMSNNYHVHAFVGIYINGTEYALPRGIGVAEPVNPNDLSINYATMCFYYTHTHDSTGVVHVEDPNNGMLDVPPTDSKYILQNFFDVWGISVNPLQFGQFAGPLRVFTSGQIYRGDQDGQTVPESALTEYVGDPNQIPIYSHEVIWFLVGPNYPASLPSVNFYTEY